MKQRIVIPLLLVAFAAALPLVLQSGFQMRLATMMWVYALLGVSFNLLFGLAGQLSLGQQAFFAIGGFAYALLQSRWGLPLVPALVAAMCVCALFAVVVGFPVLRLRTHQLAMATLMFAMAVHDLALRWTEVTGGSAGLPVAAAELFGTRLERLGLYGLIAALAVMALLLQSFIMATPVGRAWRAIKRDEVAARSLGIHVTRYKIGAFALAGALAGAAGVCNGLLSRHVDASYAGVGMVVSLLTLAVVGGLGSRTGALLGAAVVILSPQLLSGLQEYQTLVYGAALLACLVFLPKGIAGKLESMGRRP